MHLFANIGFDMVYKAFSGAFGVEKESVSLLAGDKLHSELIFLRALESIENNRYVRNRTISTRSKYRYSQAMRVLSFCPQE